MSYVVEWRTKSQEELINRVKSNLDTIKMSFFEIPFCADLSAQMQVSLCWE